MTAGGSAATPRQAQASQGGNKRTEDSGQKPSRLDKLGIEVLWRCGPGPTSTELRPCLPELSKNSELLGYPFIFFDAVEQGLTLVHLSAQLELF
jgi:hypothetical protein